jgi:hypothetical protein
MDGAAAAGRGQWHRRVRSDLTAPAVSQVHICDVCVGVCNKILDRDTIGLLGISRQAAWERFS